MLTAFLKWFVRVLLRKPSRRRETNWCRMSNIYTAPFQRGAIGDKLYFYITGTSTPQNTYADAELNTAHDHPVEADANGDFPVIYFDPELPDYRVDYKDINGVSYPGFPVDDIPPAQRQSQTYLLKGDAPELLLHETDASANEGKWRIRASGGVLLISSRNDADSSGEDILRIVRNGTSLDTFEINGDPIGQEDSFTATLTGVSGTVTGTVDWFRSGKQVTLYFPSALYGVSDDTDCTIEGLPPALWPPSKSSSIAVPAFADNGAIVSNVSMTIATDGTIEIGKGLVGGGFTASGGKGFIGNVPITYLLI